MTVEAAVSGEVLQQATHTGVDGSGIQITEPAMR